MPGSEPGRPTAEAIVLVGGQGTRLRPLTIVTPKPMLPTAGVPFLAHQICRLAGAGLRRIVLATAYLPDAFTGHFGDGAAYGVELDYVTEERPLGTGGAIRNAVDRLRGGPDEPVVVLNGDVLSGHDLSAQLTRHAERDADVTLHLTAVENPRAFGAVPVDESGRVTAFLEKTPRPVTNRVNAGCYVFRRRVLERIPAGRPVSVERETFPGLLAEGFVVIAHDQQAYWLDVGTPAAYVRGSADLVLGRLPSAALPGPPGPWWAAVDAEVATDALLTGGSALGPGVRVGAGAVVDGSVILARASIADRAVVRRSAIGTGAEIGTGAVLEDVVVADGARVGAGNEFRSGARIWTDAEIPPRSVRFSSDL